MTWRYVRNWAEPYTFVKTATLLLWGCRNFLAGLSAFLTPLAVAQQAHPHPPVHPRYTIVDHGLTLVRTLTDTPGLNNRGDIAIWHPVNASFMPGLVVNGDQTFTIDGEKDFSLVYPADLNDQLTVVGTLQEPQDLRFTQAFRWAASHLETLPSLGGKYSVASAVNAAGEVVGSALLPNGNRHAVLWKGSEAQDLGLLAKGDFSSAHSINDKGDVVGEANTFPNGQPQAFLWRAGKMQQLPTLRGGTYCTAQAINNAGIITGSCDLPNGSRRGVVWRGGPAVDLGTLGDEDAPSTALDINARAQVVGTSEATSDHLRAFIWERGKIINLNQLIPANSGWLLLVASRINDKGEILGRGYFHGNVHTFLLQPDTPQQTSHK
jgi:probable HAF family extracellular repeat protein